MPLRPVLTLVAAALATAATVIPAQAQDYPNKRISLIVPLPPGASTDGLARILADRLSQKDRLGQPIVVENRPGAAAYIGHDFVAKAPPDGYTVLLATQLLAAPKVLYALETFDPTRLVPVGRIASSPFLVVVPAEIPPKTLPEFIKYSQANPDRLNYGVVPNSIMQLDMINFGQITGAKLTEIPFNGAAPIATAILGNQVQMSFLGVSAIPHIQSGKIRALAVASKTRWARMPDVPSMTELGLDFESGFWYGLAVPAGTPQPVIARLSRELAETLKQQDVKDAIFRLGMDTLDGSPTEMTAQLERERRAGSAAAARLKPAAK